MEPTDLGGSPPGPHPPPPVDLASRTLPLREFTSPCFRIHRCTLDPIFFGRTGNSRYDAPNQEYGTLYVARDRYGALMETIGRFRGPSGHIVVDTEMLGECCYARIEASRRLRLVDLTHGAPLAHLGADARLWTGDYSVSQAWALALWSHPEQPDGLLYRARHAPERFSVAIFDRVSTVLTSTSRGSLLHGRNRGFVYTSLERASAALV